jgi:hypothetical protein
MAIFGRSSDPGKNDLDENIFATMGRLDQDKEMAPNDPNVNIAPFAGRIGGVGITTLSRNSSNEKLLKSIPDAKSLMTFAEAFDLRPFQTAGLWKAALMEGMGINSDFASLGR